MTLDDLVGDIPLARREPGGFILTIREDQTAINTNFRTGLAAAQAIGGIRRLLQGPVAAGLVQIGTTVRQSDAAIAVTLAPGRTCGFATVRDRTGRLLLEVKPKVDGADLFKLLSLAGDPRSYFVHRAAELTATRESSLAELFVQAYLTAIKNLLGTSGLRGLHQEHERTLVLRAKGRIRVPQYLREFAAGRPQLIPCSFSAHAVDNVVNRILRWALHVLVSSASTSSSRLSQLDRLDASFAGIALQRMTVSDLNRVARLPESFSNYFVSGALPIATFIIRNLNLGALPGDLEASSVTFPAHEVFERAFANEAARRGGEHVDAVAQVEWPIQALKPTGEQKIGTFKPDLVLLPIDGRAGLVADTKWKTCIQEGVATGLSPELEAGIDLPGIRLHNADLFQILAYMEAAKRLHNDDRFVGVLVYPVANVREEDLVPIEIKAGFANDGKTLSVFLLPWDVGAECSTRTDVLWTHLNTLRNMPHA